MTFDRSLFDTYEPVTDANVEMGTKATTKVIGKGSIVLRIQCGTSFKLRRLEDVLHIPSFEYSLLSVSTMDKKGMKTTFGDGKCVIHKSSMTVATGYLEGSLYVIHTRPVNSSTNTSLVASLQTWHQRMAHVNSKGILQMADRGVVHGLKLKDRTMEHKCHDCCVGKAHRVPIPKERTSPPARQLLSRIHSDVCGPFEVPSLGGSRYFVALIDEFSNWVTIYFMKQKSEVVGHFLQFEKFAERQTGHKIQVLRSDRGGEYLSEGLQSYFKHQGIVHEMTAAYTPHQNGVAERFNRTSLDLVRSMLHQMKVPKCFWAEALSTAVYIRNRVTSRSLPSDKTPHHFWNRSTPTVAHLRIFGCKCWYTLPKVKVQKLDSRGRLAMFVGYAESSKAYKVIDLETMKFVESRDVTFDESSIVGFSSELESGKVDFSEVVDCEEGEQISLELSTQQTQANNSSSMNNENTSTDSSNEPEDNTNASASTSSDSDHEVPDSAEDDQNDDEETETERVTSDGHVLRSGRVSKTPGSWWRAYSAKEQHNALMATSTRQIPNSYNEAVTGPDAKFWKQGIDSELASLKKYKTWKLVPRSTARGRKVLKTKWVFVEKQHTDEDGTSTPFPKGRNVVKGFEQVQGVDYNETFAPVVKYTSVRVLCAEVAEEDLELHQMDAKTAFLNGIIDEEVFIEIPEGVQIEKSDLAELGVDTFEDIEKLDLVGKLEKSMYGTKQAPRCWNKKINSVLSDELGFTRSTTDPCIYRKNDVNGVMIIALYVDDLLLAAKGMNQISWIKKMFSERFEMKDLGEAKVCLGLEITRNRAQKKLYLSQQSYMNKIVDRFGMSESKPMLTPMEEPKSAEDKLEWISDDDQDAVDVPYREAIGSLMYLMIGSRPDIAFAVGKLSRFCESPKWKHWLAVKRVLRYVNGTLKLGLCYDGSKSEVVGYSDSDWAGDVSDRKSTSAYVFMMAGAAVSWCSRKQTITATSSCEAEYVAMNMTCKEAVWLKRLLADISISKDLTSGIMVRADSQSAMKMAKNESINRRNKHIDITYHYVREVTENGEVYMVYVPTDSMAADMLTKALGRIKFLKFRNMCGISSVEETQSSVSKGEC